MTLKGLKYAVAVVAFFPLWRFVGFPLCFSSPTIPFPWFVVFLFAVPATQSLRDRIVRLLDRQDEGKMFYLLYV